MTQEAEPLPNKTYKFKAEPITEHAFYFTIVGDPPRRFFLNCKSMASFQWISALMAAYSKLLKQGVSIETIIEMMKETFSPGGSYIRQGTNETLPSIVHHLGLILEQHVKK